MGSAFIELFEKIYITERKFEEYEKTLTFDVYSELNNKVSEYSVVL